MDAKLQTAISTMQTVHNTLSAAKTDHEQKKKDATSAHDAFLEAKEEVVQNERILFRAANPDPAFLLRAAALPDQTWANGVRGVAHYVAAGFQGTGNVLCTIAALSTISSDSVKAYGIGVPGALLAIIPHQFVDFFDRRIYVKRSQETSLANMATQAWPAEMHDGWLDGQAHPNFAEIKRDLAQQKAPGDEKMGVGLKQLASSIDGRIAQRENFLKALAGYAFGTSLSLADSPTYQKGIIAAATGACTVASLIAACVTTRSYRAAADGVVRSDAIDLPVVAPAGGPASDVPGPSDVARPSYYATDLESDDEEAQRSAGQRADKEAGAFLASSDDATQSGPALSSPDKATYKEAKQALIRSLRISNVPAQSVALLSAIAMPLCASGLAIGFFHGSKDQDQYVSRLLPAIAGYSMSYNALCMLTLTARNIVASDTKLAGTLRRFLRDKNSPAVLNLQQTLAASKQAAQSAESEAARRRGMANQAGSDVQKAEEHYTQAQRELQEAHKEAVDRGDMAADAWPPEVLQQWRPDTLPAPTEAPQQVNALEQEAASSIDAQVGQSTSRTMGNRALERLNNLFFRRKRD